MAPSMIRAYNPYIDNSRYTNDISTKQNAKAIEKKKTAELGDRVETKHTTKGFNTETSISQEEREFFKKLFPDSADLIQQHTLFTRNGKTQNVQVAKGVLLDSRI